MLILFDIDDTLINHSRAYRFAAERLHREARCGGLVEDFLLRWKAAQERHYPRFLEREISFLEQRRERIRETIDATLSDDDADRIFAGYFAIYESGWAPFPDVLPCLDRLSAYRLGVISNGHGIEQRDKLSRAGILDRFDGVFISDDCGSAKPSAQIFLHACSVLGESPANTVYVGDRYDLDAEGARQAGLHGVWLDRNNTAAAHHAAPIIRTLDELLSILVAMDN